MDNHYLTLRVQVYPLVEKYLSPGGVNEGGGGESSPGGGSGKKPTARNDRLVQLVIKGLLYESCVDYCQVSRGTTLRVMRGL